MKRRSFRLAALLLVTLVFASGALRSLAQANASPPERLTYQGFLVDGNGVALANTAPKNYDVIFKIYNHETAGAPVNLLWGEQQTVTVDKGYFSVLLGEGAAVAGVPRDGILLSSLFRGATASDRYVGITVKGIGAGGADVDIQPRLRLLSSPYAFLAQQAVKLVRTDNGSDLISSAGNAVTISGGLAVAGNNVFELGAGVAGKEASAGKIGYSIFTPDTLDIVGAGTTGLNRKVRIWAEGGSSFSGPVTATSFAGDGSGLAGVAKLSGGNTFSGTQILNHNLGIGTGSPGFPLTFAPVLGDKISLWGDAGNHYGFGIQGGTLQIHTANAGDVISFGYGTSANLTEAMRITGGGRVTASGGFLARGGYPGGNNANNNGYAFSGNGGDNDSGMFSDTDGHVRFTSNSQLKLSVYPGGVFSHGPLYADGPVGIGTASPGSPLEIRWGDPRVTMGYPGSPAMMQVGRYSDATFIGANYTHHTTDFRWAYFNGDSNWDFASDRKLKKDIEDAEPLLDRALKVQVRRFRWKDAPPEAEHQLGVIAQELQPLFPDLVNEVENPQTKEKELTVGYGDFAVIAIKAIQELKAAHDAELAELRGEMTELKAQMATLLRVNGELQKQSEKGATTAAATLR